MRSGLVVSGNMTKAVFIASSHSHYDDQPGVAYHFPNLYLGRVSQTIGDWIVYYQGKRGGSPGYYGVQKVARIEPDPADKSHSYAIMDRASELGFENLVPRLRRNGTPWETGLPLSRGSNTAAVRIISEDDFAAIIAEGLREENVPDALPRDDPYPAVHQAVQHGFADPPAGFQHFRPTVLSERAFRDRAFSRQVRRAYGGRCAMSGLALRNGGGRPEVEAAHIVPVEAAGPDTVRNGLALSGTVHWMFDRGLVSVDDDGKISDRPRQHCSRYRRPIAPARQAPSGARKLSAPPSPHLSGMASQGGL
jgi:putative restriction endonuclease